MLARYKIYRGQRPSGEPLPQGIRQDTRKHTRHILRPSATMVATFLAAGSAQAWKEFRDEYRRLVEQRFAEDRTPFDRLAELASLQDVYLGCSCPTAKNPDVMRCHTVLALRFVQRKYPQLTVALP